MFDIVDRVYGDYKLALKGGGGAPPEGEEGGGATGGGGGSFGGGGGGGEDLDFGEEGTEEGETSDTEEGAEGVATPEGAEGETPEGTEAETPENLTESIKKVNNILNDKKNILANKLNERTKKYKGKFVDLLVGSIKSDIEKEIDTKVKIHDKNIKINEGINNMVDDIDKMLDK
jgi:hypothetical protein